MANGKLTYEIGLQVNKAGLTDLQATLNQIKNLTTSDLLDLNKGMNIKEAKFALNEIQESAKNVQSALSQAYNPKLGTTDVKRFNQILKNSNINLNEIQASFSKAGAAGQTAFRNLATSLLTTNLQLKETKTILDKMGETMSNTIKWGLSSSIFNNFTSSISKSINYVKTLDEDLNNIRIVSGQSAEQMESFAKQANKAAKALGTSTTAYAKGAQIFYQQGLTGKDVTERTDVVTKMTNVTGDAAEDVSSYMTAIWNNFYDGSQSLEHYADVITALGASTASSSAEIAEGLEKFAAVGQTIGLTYDYATAALATVVSNTRQSADTVGTAFKTIFSRLQGLNLGETLDDGTTLTKYSKALDAVGVSIKDQDGQLKDMNTILDELATKWVTLSKDQQVALAQTVAGTRQYTQLVALMDNWGDMTMNLQTAADATGTLNKQQSIYMESVAAHEEKMNASLQGFKEAMLDEDTLKSYYDLIGGIVDQLTGIVNAFGGGENALLALGSTALRVFKNQIGQSISETIANLKTTNENLRLVEARMKLINELKIAPDSKGLDDIIIKEKEFLHFKSLITPKINEEASALLQERDQILNEADAWQQTLRNAEEYYKKITHNENFKIEDYAKGGTNGIKWMDDDNPEKTVIFEDKLEEINNQLQLNDTAMQKFRKNAAQGKASQEDLVTSSDQEKTVLQNLGNQIDEVLRQDILLASAENELIQIKERYNQIINNHQEGTAWTAEEITALQNVNTEYTNFINKVKKGAQDARKVIDQEANGASNNINNKLEENSKTWDNFMKKLKSGELAANITNTIGALGQLVSGFNNLANIGNILDNEDLTNWEKFSQIAMALGSAIPMIYLSLQTLKPVIIELGVTIWSAVAPILPILLAIAAAVALVGGAIYAGYKYWTRYETALKRAKEEVERTTQALKDAKTAYDDLKNTISNYQEATDAIGKLEEGTLEFYEAIQKANEAAQELIDTYGLIAGQDVTIGNNGQIVIKQNAIDKVTEEQVTKYYESLANNYRAKANEIEAEKNVLYNNLSKDLNKTLREAGKNLRITDNDAKRIMQAYGYGENTVTQLSFLGDVWSNTNSILSSFYNNTIGRIDLLRHESSISDDKLQTKINETLANSKLQEQTYNIQQQEYIRQQEQALLQASFTPEERDIYKQMTPQQKDILNNYGTIVNEETKDKFAEQAKKDAKTIYTIEQYRAFRSQSFWELLKAISQHPFTFYPVVDEKQKELDNNRKENVDTIYNNLLEEQYGNNSQILFEAYKYGKSSLGYGYLSTDPETGEILPAQDPTEWKQFLLNLSPKQQDYRDQLATATMVLAAGSSAAQKFDWTTISDEAFKEVIIGDTVTSKFKPSVEDYGTGIFKDIIADAQNTVRNKISFGDENKYKIDQKTGNIVDANGKEVTLSEIREAAGIAFNQDNYNSQNLSNYNKVLNENAEALGTSAKALKLYAQAERNANEELEYASQNTANVIVESYSFNKKYNDGIKTFNDNVDALNIYTKALKNHEQVAYDVTDAIGEIDSALENVGIRLSEDAYTDDTVINNIKKLFNGTEKEAEEAYKALKSYSIAKEFETIGKQAGLTSKQIESITNQIEKLRDENVTYSIKADGTEFVDNINTILSYLKLSQVEAQQWLDDHGLVITASADNQTGLKEVKTKDSTQSQHHKVSYNKNPYTGADGQYDLEWDDEIITYGTSYWVLDNKDDNLKIDYVSPSTNNYTNFKKSQSNSSSGGGGNKSQKDLQETEEDRYQRVNEELAKLSATMAKLQKQEDRLIGSEKIDNLIKQIKTINSQIDSTREKLLVANTILGEKKKELLNYGIQFDADGLITNYSQIYQSALATYNAAIDKYNNSAQGESDEKELEEAEKTFNKITELVTDYDELIGSTIPDLENNLEEYIDNQIELKIKVLDANISISLDFDNALKQWAEFKKKVLDDIKSDDYVGEALFNKDRFKQLLQGTNGTSLIQELVKNVTIATEEFTKVRNGETSTWFSAQGVNSESQALAYLKEKQEQLMQYMEELDELEENLLDNLISQLGKVQDKMDEQNDLYENLHNTYQHNIKLIQSIYGDTAYSKMSEYYKAVKNTYDAQYKVQQANTQYWLTQMNSLEEGTEQWNTARDNWISALETEQSTLENYIQSMTDEYINSIQAIFEKINEEITSGNGLDYISEEWGLINKEAEHYLDTVNATYGIQQIANKYLDAIDQTDNIKYQEKLRDLMNEQVKALKEQDRLTQYDLDRAELKYQIALKRIQLEEAQQNKSTMRLRRDSQGNYTYQYASDNDEVSSLQEELSNLYNQLYNMDTAEYKSNLDSIYSLWTEYQQKMVEAAQINDPEERLAREELLTKYYGDLIDGYVSENEEIKQNLYESTFLELEDLYGRDSENVRNWLDDKDSAMKEMIYGWNSTLQQMADKIREEGGFTSVYGDALDEISKVTDGYQTEIDNVASAMEELVGGNTGTTGILNNLVDATEQYIKDSKDGVETIKEYISEIDNLAKSYEAAKEALVQLQKAQGIQEDYYKQEIIKTNQIATSQNVANASTTSTTPTSPPPEQVRPVAETVTAPSLNKGSYVNVKAGTKWYGNSYGGGSWGYASAGTIKYTANAPYGYNIDGKGWIRKEDIVGYASGGYTGDWTGDGKLALLHQKEIVLNAKDTANLLNTVAIMRNITNSLGEAVLSRLSGLSSGAVAGRSSDTLQQQVAIEANFPNVTSANEIEEALNNLVNAASQYIGR